jgi:hypothetical protein
MLFLGLMMSCGNKTTQLSKVSAPESKSMLEVEDAVFIILRRSMGKLQISKLQSRMREIGMALEFFEIKYNNKQEIEKLHAQVRGNEFKADIASDQDPVEPLFFMIQKLQSGYKVIAEKYHNIEPHHASQVLYNGGGGLIIVEHHMDEIKIKS